MRNKEKRKAAMKLRIEGFSYNLISEKTGVSKSTLHGWLAGVPYTPNDLVRKRIGEGRANATKTKHLQKLASFQLAAKLAKRDLGTIKNRDRLVAGLAIYLGEGEKNENVGIINADQRIITFMVSWLKEFYGVQNDNLTLAIHLYPDNNTATCLQYWSNVTGIPLTQFGKTQVDRRPNKKLGKRGKLPYGTAHLRVKSKGNKDLGVLLSRRIQASIDIILKSRA